MYTALIHTSHIISLSKQSTEHIKPTTKYILPYKLHVLNFAAVSAWSIHSSMNCINVPRQFLFKHYYNGCSICFCIKNAAVFFLSGIQCAGTIQIWHLKLCSFSLRMFFSVSTMRFLRLFLIGSTALLYVHVRKKVTQNILFHQHIYMALPSAGIKLRTRISVDYIFGCFYTCTYVPM